MTRVRCAIYTRKSSDEGLEQSFNSLDAQHEACAAYIRSQASEGWTESRTRYDDGGLSGGTLARPALQRLLADVAAGAVDIIVVYKVDRLTRSLLDFARLVEAFDASGASFVSVTQSFNTTTSMGRLTLNMLLSFAQFEREVTAERIRDKIAASKARGMWMGGIPPLGYRADGRSLAVVAPHAAIVQTIFARYLALGTVRRLAEALDREGIHSPQRVTGTGRRIGGVPFSRGQLYAILANRIYLGQIEHKNIVHPGLHDAIIDEATWDAARAMLLDHRQGERHGATRVTPPALLAGLIVDADGVPLVATHATKGRVRYHYYVSRGLQHGQTGGRRLPAREIEIAVATRLAVLFDDPVTLAALAHLDGTAAYGAAAVARAAALAARARRREPALIRALVREVRVTRDGVEITCATEAIAAAMEVARIPDTPDMLALATDARVQRSGGAVRLVQANGAAVDDRADPVLIRLVARAHRLWALLRQGEVDIPTLARTEGVTPSYLTRILRLAFLSPAVVEAVLAGRQRAGIDAAALTATDAIAACWTAQRAAMLPGAG